MEIKKSVCFPHEGKRTDQINSPQVFPKEENMRTSMSIRSACFHQRGKHADGVPFFTGSALFIWESALHFTLRTCGLLSGKKINPPTLYRFLSLSILSVCIKPLRFLLSEAQPKNTIVNPSPPNLETIVSHTRAPAQFIFFSYNFSPALRVKCHNFAIRQVPKFYNFQALLNHRANACSCFRI
jgi:hypothetical protein